MDGLRRLVVMVEDTPRPRALLAPSDARGLPASVLAVVEREADVVNHDDRMVIIL